MEILAFIVGIIWLIFPFAVLSSLGKQREANRAHLDAIERQTEETNKRLSSANQMHGDLNRAAQWFVDRETQGASK